LAAIDASGPSAPDLWTFPSASQGIGGGHGGSSLESEESMANQRQWYAGADWAPESHHAFVRTMMVEK
jgi:hypothetical protein